MLGKLHSRGTWKPLQLLKQQETVEGRGRAREWGAAWSTRSQAKGEEIKPVVARCIPDERRSHRCNLRRRTE